MSVFEQGHDPNNSAKVIGINDEGMKKAVLDIYECAENVAKRLGNIEELMKDVEDYYSCDAAVNLYESFNSFKTNFSIVTGNIKSYGDDLNKVRNNFQKMEMDFKSGLTIKDLEKEG